MTVTGGVFPLVLCFYYVCIILTFSISVFNCGLSIFNKRILVLLLLLLLLLSIVGGSIKITRDVHTDDWRFTVIYMLPVNDGEHIRCCDQNSTQYSRMRKQSQFTSRAATVQATSTAVDTSNLNSTTHSTGRSYSALDALGPSTGGCLCPGQGADGRPSHCRDAGLPPLENSHFLSKNLHFGSFFVDRN